MRLAEYLTKAIKDLKQLYPEEEARSIVSLLIQHRLGLPSYAPVTDPDREIPTDQLEKDLERLTASEPVQYVLGYAEFYGRRFRVTPDVLIPRPETEELVEAVLKSPVVHNHDPRIVDLCTGSGCIAWTLALEIPDATVVGVDISPKALALARSQRFPVAAGNDGPVIPDPIGDPRVSFRRANILKPDLPIKGPFDIIVSNPPYIAESERAQMRRNVLDYEPALALFVPDEDPLKFYRALARHTTTLLAPGGFGIFEINPAFSEEIADILKPDFTDIQILKDISGRDRFVSFRNTE